MTTIYNQMLEDVNSVLECSWIRRLDYERTSKCKVIECSEKYHYIVEYQAVEDWYDDDVDIVGLKAVISRFLRTDATVSQFTSARIRTYNVENLSYFINILEEPYDNEGDFSLTLPATKCDLCSLFKRNKTLPLHEHHDGMCHQSSQRDICQIIQKIPAKLPADLCHLVASYL